MLQVTSWGEGTVLEPSQPAWDMDRLRDKLTQAWISLEAL